jgi:2-dehydro-3-deoxyphosphooctonate aldolase (KDO 8-P synthase)
VDGFFLETHPEPSKALSDAAAMLPISQLPALLEGVARVLAAVRG